jgi:hypothetical protein
LQRSSFFARAWLKVDVEHRTLGCKSYLPFSRIHVKWDRPQGHRKSEDKGKERERERERERTQSCLGWLERLLKVVDLEGQELGCGGRDRAFW